ncbi:MAG: preprotein translocase subunit SecE [Planctomycetes bacterium]|nr:preprotein translocase subunit SecE [Planctomycetota bacterium]
MAYKKDQGRLARMAAYWSLALLILYGCQSLYTMLPTWSEGLGKPLIESQPKIPILGWALNPALLICGLVLAASWFVLYRWQQTPKVADLLIDTEIELTKVTWPTMSDAVNSSLVVVGVVLFLMAFLAGMDAMLGWWTTRVLLGK